MIEQATSNYLLPPPRTLEQVRDDLTERMRACTDGELTWALYCRIAAVEREIANRRTGR